MDIEGKNAVSATGEKAVLPRVMNVFDATLFYVAAIVSIGWLASAAAIGVPSLTLWLIAAITFFIPHAYVAAELGTALPGEGGIYLWTKEAMGNFAGFMCGWFYWVNNFFYFPMTVIALVTILFAFYARELVQDMPVITTVAIAVFWLISIAGIIGLKVGKWIPNIGGLCKVALGAIVLGLCFSYAIFHGIANDFAISNWVPTINMVWAPQAPLFSFAFAFAGFEILSSLGDECKNPRKDVPRAIFLTAIISALIYIVGTLAILVVIPYSEINILTGMIDAIRYVLRLYGAETAIYFIGFLIVLISLGTLSTWILGPVRILFCTGLDKRLPSIFGHVNEKFKTPDFALLVQAIIATVLLSFGYFYPKEAVTTFYWTLFSLCAILYFIPYLFMFVDVVLLRWKRPEMPRKVRIPGGLAGVLAISALGFLVTLISIGFAFIPPPETELLAYEFQILGGTLAFLVAGILLYVASEFIWRK
ncbi:amino acid permease [Candidatus Bathyarchaeota archaeon]|nr:amino acid permease [Candidatus Bathyarchaeota archaeon]